MRPFSWLKAGEGREHASSNPLCAPAASLPGTLGNPSAGGCHLAAVPSPALDYFTSSVSPSLLQTYFPMLHLLRGAQWILCPETLPFADQEGLAASGSWSSKGTSFIIPRCLLRGCYGCCIWLSGYLPCHSVHPPSDGHGFLTPGSLLWLYRQLSPGNTICT